MLGVLHGCQPLARTHVLALLVRAGTVAGRGVAGVLGLSGPNTFYLTLEKKKGLDGKYAALGKVMAGLDLLQGMKKCDAIRSVRITRVGQAARDFRTDDEGFKRLMERR
jgi:hypothetical protein